jgi:hypothetical protein
MKIGMIFLKNCLEADASWCFDSWQEKSVIEINFGKMGGAKFQRPTSLEVIALALVAVFLAAVILYR